MYSSPAANLIQTINKLGKVDGQRRVIHTDLLARQMKARPDDIAEQLKKLIASGAPLTVDADGTVTLSTVTK